MLRVNIVIDMQPSDIIVTGYKGSCHEIINKFSKSIKGQKFHS